MRTSPRCPKAPKRMLSVFIAGTGNPEPDWLTGPARPDIGCYIGRQAPTRRSFGALIIEFACFPPTKMSAPAPNFTLSRFWNRYEYFLDLSDLMPFFHFFLWLHNPSFPRPSAHCPQQWASILDTIWCDVYMCLLFPPITASTQLTLGYGIGYRPTGSCLSWINGLDR